MKIRDEKTINKENDTRDKENETQTQEKLLKNTRISLGIGAIEGANTVSIYSSFLSATFTQFVHETGKFIFFPTAAALASIQALLAWREAYLNGGERSSLIKASIETGAALAVTAVVIGSLVAQTLFAVASGYVFTILSAVKTLYHTGSMLYYLHKSSRTNDEKDKMQAKNHAVAASAGLFATAAAAFVMVFGAPKMAVLGIIAGTIGALFTTYKTVQLLNNKKVVANPANSPANSNSFGLFGLFSLAKNTAVKYSQNSEVNARDGRGLVSARQF